MLHSIGLLRTRHHKGGDSFTVYFILFYSIRFGLSLYCTAVFGISDFSTLFFTMDGEWEEDIKKIHSSLYHIMTYFYRGIIFLIALGREEEGKEIWRREESIWGSEKARSK